MLDDWWKTPNQNQCSFKDRIVATSVKAPRGDPSSVGRAGKTKQGAFFLSPLDELHLVFQQQALEGRVAGSQDVVGVQVDLVAVL